MLADHAGARVTCDELDIEMSRANLDATMLAFARGPRGVSSFWRGDLERARTVLEELVAEPRLVQLRGEL